MSVYIFDNPDSHLKIKSFSSSTRGERATIRIELETDLDWLSFILKELAETQKAQRQKPRPAQKAKPAKPKLLALPAPQLALPKPGDRG